MSIAGWWPFTTGVLLKQLKSSMGRLAKHFLVSRSIIQLILSSNRTITHCMDCPHALIIPLLFSPMICNKFKGRLPKNLVIQGIVNVTTMNCVLNNFRAQIMVKWKLSTVFNYESSGIHRDLVMQLPLGYIHRILLRKEVFNSEV